MANKISKIFRVGKSLLKGCFWYPRDFFYYRRMQKNAGLTEPFYFMPRVLDKDPASHTFDRHYVYMDRWAFKYLLQERPDEHVDVGSSIRFLSMASCATRLKFVDIRPVKIDFDNYECIEGSILQMPFADNSVKSLSCLHVAEHIGLGRYGDPLDVNGTQKACRELMRVLAPGGKLYFALPVGRPAVYFNAHRVHDPTQVTSYFKELHLLSFSAVGDDGHFYPNTKPASYQQAGYACGMYEFTK